MTKTPELIVGLTGRKRVGKDTFAKVLVEEHGYTRASFAEPLKAAALRLDPIVAGDNGGDVMRLSDVVARYGWETAKDTFPEVRRTLQRLGTDAIRAIDSEFWVRNAFETLDVEGPVVFTDVRFPNEADAIRERGGLIVRIERQHESDGDDHSSETAMDSYEVDCVVRDDRDEPRTVEQLHDSARAFAAQAPLAAILAQLVHDKN